MYYNAHDPLLLQDYLSFDLKVLPRMVSVYFIFDYAYNEQGRRKIFKAQGQNCEMRLLASRKLVDRALSISLKCISGHFQ